MNCLSASIDVDIAFKCIEKKLYESNAKPADQASVLIVAPYKPHVVRINQLINLEYRNRGYNENLNYIRTGTIHSLQGSEADIVIFDLVVDEPHQKANLFLSGKDINENLKKMFNVAITRARFKLYVVGNFAYCRKRAKNNALADLLDELFDIQHLKAIEAKTLFPMIAYSEQINTSADSVPLKHMICREESFDNFFLKDINTFRNQLIMFSPFMTEYRIGRLLPYFKNAINSGKKIIIITKALSDRDKTELSKYKKCEQILRDIGASIIHKKGMHEKLILVDNETVWNGSLNCLSFNGRTGEVMSRFSDENLTMEYMKNYHMEYLT